MRAQAQAQADLVVVEVPLLHREGRLDVPRAGGNDLELCTGQYRSQSGQWAVRTRFTFDKTLASCPAESVAAKGRVRRCIAFVARVASLDAWMALTTLGDGGRPRLRV